MVILRRFTFAIALLFAATSVTACTCNKAGTSRKARPKNGQKMTRGKVKKAKFRKMKRKGKAKGGRRVEATLFLIDQKKFDAGDPNYWVEVTRSVGGRAPAKNAVWNLFKGPNAEEKARGLTFFNNEATGFQGFSIAGDTVTLQLREGCANNGGAVTVYDHISKTLKKFPEIAHVRLLGPNDTVPTEKGDHRPACLEP